MSAVVILPSASSAMLIDTEAAIVVQLNALLRRSGLHLSTASTQLHVMPEKVYLLSGEDMALLSRYARNLVEHTLVQCDFGALSAVLWGHAKEVEKVLDCCMQQWFDDESRPQEMISRSVKPSLLILTQVFHTLRHTEEPFARQEVKDGVVITQKDVEVVLRLALKVSHLFDRALKNIQRSDASFLHLLELCLATILIFVATIARRKAIDVDSTLAFLNSDLTWRLSGTGAAIAESYCDAICRFIFAIFSRQDVFVSVEEVAVQLLLNRLTNRPPFDWEIFRRLCRVRDGEISTMRSLTPQYGILRFMSIVQHSVETLFLSTEEPWIKSFRRQAIRSMRRMNEDKKMLSFFQVSVLGALEGMPQVDLSDDAELQRRSRVTHLCIEGDSNNNNNNNNNNNDLQPNFLRILLAHGFTVPRVEHCVLKRASIVSLLRAIAEQLFQLPLIQSGEIMKLTDLILIPPLLTRRLVRFIVDTITSDVGMAPEILSEIHKITEIIYNANISQSASFLSAKRMPAPIRRVSVAVMELLFMFFESDIFLYNTNHFTALKSLGQIFAVLAFYSSAKSNATESEKQASLRFIKNVSMKLSALTQMMTAEEIKLFFIKVLLPCTSVENLLQRNRQQYALQEAYVRAFASSAVALVMDEKTMLAHWVDISLRCIRNSISGALSLAGLDFFSAAFLSKQAIAPLFVPTYVALMIPISNDARYGEPPLFLVRHFAKTVRPLCQALEECDERALVEMMHNPNSSLKKFLSEMYGEGNATPSLENVRPISCVLLLVSALFDKLCLVLGHTVAAVSTGTVSRQERVARFHAYFSALINLLQCRSRAVLHRVCASVEAIVLDHLRSVPSAQTQWMKYVTSTVDLVEGVGKKELVEWLLKLKEKAASGISQSKL